MLYSPAMADTDLGILLGRALRELRLRTTKTQDRWHDRTGMAQSWLSALERGDGGWESVRRVGDALDRVGVDPLELLRVAVRDATAPDDEVELLALWAQADDRARKVAIDMLTTMADLRQNRAR